MALWFWEEKDQPQIFCRWPECQCVELGFNCLVDHHITE